jgi:N-methylhydantoinase A
MRYAGQNYELPIRLPEGPIDFGTLDQLAEAFTQAHQRLYGFVADGEPVQLVTYRVEAIGLVPKAQLNPQPDAGPDASGAVIGARDVWLPEASGFVSCKIYDRDKLQAGNRIMGPAIVEQMDATTVVLPNMSARVEPYLNLILEAV